MLAKSWFYKFALLLGFFFFPSFLFAQCGDVPCDVPIDGGLSFLIAIGVAYGVSKRKNR